MRGSAQALPEASLADEADDDRNVCSTFRGADGSELRKRKLGRLYQDF